jgi:hypothetical protein
VALGSNTPPSSPVERAQRAGRLLTVPVQTLSDRGRVALKHTLSLDDAEVERLAAKLPFEAQLTALPDDRRRRLEATVSVVVSEPRIAYEPCSKHPRLASDRICPKCEERTCAACHELSDAGLCPRCTAKSRRRSTFKTIRVTVLLAILAAVALSTYADKRAIQSWERPLAVRVYPIAVEADADTEDYAQRAEARMFAAVPQFLEREALRYGVETSPLMEITVDHSLGERPPLPPLEPGVVDAMLYSLRLRWFASDLEGAADVKLFVLFYRPAPGKSVPHSIGLERGHVGIVHAFAGAEHEPRNAVVMAHELLHTAGASDKYDEHGAPIYPAGYADPSAREQTKAELMAAALPTPTGARPALHLDECVVGEATAREIGWVEADAEIPAGVASGQAR